MGVRSLFHLQLNKSLNKEIAFFAGSLQFLIFVRIHFQHILILCQHIENGQLRKILCSFMHSYRRCHVSSTPGTSSSWTSSSWTSASISSSFWTSVYRSSSPWSSTYRSSVSRTCTSRTSSCWKCLPLKHFISTLHERCNIY